MDSPAPRAYALLVPTVTLTYAELADLAMAAHAAAWRASQDAVSQANAVTETTFKATASRYQALAEKLEQARSAGPPQR